MKPDDVKRLIGGYATGTLTADEQRALFNAALEDQELFDALAGEQTLKAALDDAAVRRELIADLTPAPSWRDRMSAWLRPAAPIGALGALAAATVAVVLYIQSSGPKTTEIAQAPVAPRQQQVEAPPSAPEQRAVTDKQRAQPKAKAFVPAPILDSPSPVAAPIPAPPSVAPMAAPQPAPLAVQAPSAEQFRTSVVASQAESAKKAEAVSQRADGGGPTGVVGGVPGGVVGGVIGGIVGSNAAPPPPPPAKSAAPRRAVGSRSTGMFADAVSSQPLNVQYEPQKNAEFTSLVLQANADSIAYLFRRTEAGEWAAVAPGGMSLKANVPFTTTGFVPGTAQPPAVIILSRHPLPQLAQTGSALTSLVQEMLTKAPADVLVRPVNVQ